MHKTIRVYNDKLMRKVTMLFYAIIITVLFVPYLSLGQFSDEDDNILGGLSVANGQLIYVDFYSQHTPIMYYIMALMDWAGAQTLLEFRFYFYILLSMILVLLTGLYRKDFPKATFPIFAVFYVTLHAANYEYSYAILSEHISALCFIGVFAELWRAAHGNEITIKRWLLLGFYAFIAVGVAFVSIYFVAFAGIAILYLSFNMAEVSTIKNTKAIIVGIAIALIPSALFVSAYLISGSLDDFYAQAYVLNRESYLNYLPDFKGETVFSPVLAVPDNYLAYAMNAARGLYPWNAVTARDFINVIGNLVFIVLAFRVRKGLGLISLLTLLTVPVRGMTGFHAIPYWALSAFMLAYLCALLVERKSRLKNPLNTSFSAIRSVRALRIASISIAISITTVMLIPYVVFAEATYIRNISLDRPKISNVNAANEVSKRFLIENIEGEIFQTSIDVHTFVDTNQICEYHVCGLVPWVTDIYEAEILRKLEVNPPILIFHDPRNAVWSHVVEDFAPGIDGFIMRNYEPLPYFVRGYLPDFYENAFVLKSQKSRVMATLIGKDPGTFCLTRDPFVVPKDIPVGEMTAGVKVEQSFTAKVAGLQSVAIPMADYQRENSSDIRVSLLDRSGKILATEINLALDIRSQGFVTLSFDPIANSLNEEFTILIEGTNGLSGNSFTTWMSESDAIGGVLKYNDGLMMGDLSFRVNYLEPDVARAYIECKEHFNLSNE